MERSDPEPGTPMPAAAPYHLSRDYEDRLDWLENQRRDRTKRSRGRRIVAGVAALVVGAFAYTGALLRRR